MNLFGLLFHFDVKSFEVYSEKYKIIWKYFCNFLLHLLGKYRINNIEVIIIAFISLLLFIWINLILLCLNKTENSLRLT